MIAIYANSLDRCGVLPVKCREYRTDCALHLPIFEENLPMYDYRLFYPQMSIDDQSRQRRPITGHPSRRVYRLPVERPTSRSGRR